MEHLVFSCLESRSEGNGSIYGRFLLGPFKVGQGTTVATALRRTLLSELQGIAITAVEIKGAAHQYSSIAGVQESTLDIVLNLKQIVLTGDIKNGLPAVGYLMVQGPKTARARDLKLPNGIRCVDNHQYIACVSANGSLMMKFVISAGKNYISPHSPSAQTLTPSVFQPKIREGSTTPLALRASGAPLLGLAEIGEMVRSNSPLDTQHGQRPLIRGGESPRLSGRVCDVVGSNAARRAIRLSTPSRGHRARSMERRTPVRPVRPAHGASVFSMDMQQRSFIAQRCIGESGNSRANDELRLALQSNAIGGALPPLRGQLAEMALNGTHPPSPTPNHHQALNELAQSGKQWERDLSPLPIDAIFMPVNKVNFSLQIDDQWQEPRERVILEIWTNGSVHPRQAISEAASYLVHLFSLLRQANAWPSSAAQTLVGSRRPGWGTAGQGSPSSLTAVGGQSQESEGRYGGVNPYDTALKSDSPQALPRTRGDNSIDIADLDLSVQAYVLLKRAGVHTIGDLRRCSIGSSWGEGILRPSVSLEIDALLKRVALE